MPGLAVRGLFQEAMASSFMPMCLEKGFLLLGSGSNGGARDPEVARKARKDFSDNLLQQRTKELRKEGLPSSEARRLAKEEVGETMTTLNALHNPDLVAGGKDAIADFGDGEVNSTIGRLWSQARKGELSRVQQLDQAAAQIPEAERGGSKMNGKMERCK